MGTLASAKGHKLPAGSASDPLCTDSSWGGVADCRHCAMRKTSLFSVLRGPDFDKILLPIRNAGLPAKTVIYLENQPADAVFTIRRGLVKLVKQAPDGSPRITRLLGRGAALGLEALTEGIYWHTAVAMREVDLCRIPTAVIIALQEHNLQLVDGIIRQWEHYLDYADRWITELSAGPVKTRVPRLVKLLLDISGEPSGRVVLPSSEEMAAVLATSVESVSRCIAELKRSRVLVRVAARTYHCDTAALASSEATA